MLQLANVAIVALMLVAQKLKATIQQAAGCWSRSTHNFFLPAGAPPFPEAPRHHALLHVDEGQVRLVQARNEAAVIAQLDLAPAAKETKQAATGVGGREKQDRGRGIGRGVRREGQKQGEGQGDRQAEGEEESEKVTFLISGSETHMVVTYYQVYYTVVRSYCTWL